MTKQKQTRSQKPALSQRRPHLRSSMFTKLDLLWLHIFKSWPQVADHKMGRRVMVTSIFVGEMINRIKHTVKLGLNRPVETYTFFWGLKSTYNQPDDNENWKSFLFTVNVIIISKTEPKNQPCTIEGLYFMRVSSKSTFLNSCPSFLKSTIDTHWRLYNPPIFSNSGLTGFFRCRL